MASKTLHKKWIYVLPVFIAIIPTRLLYQKVAILAESNHVRITDENVKQSPPKITETGIAGNLTNQS